jgi:hypothetical protein
MKRIIHVLLFVFAVHPVFAQDEQPGGKLREKMEEYIETKLGLDKSEAEKFQPMFESYFKELHNTNKQYRGDRLVLQQKVVELRLKYREQFKPIIGEKRSNDVFRHERDFVEKAKDVLKERQQGNMDRRSNKRKNTNLLSN